MFRQTSSLGMRYAGIGLEKLRIDAGPGFGSTVETASKEIEQKVPIIRPDIFYSRACDDNFLPLDPYCRWGEDSVRLLTKLFSQ